MSKGLAYSITIVAAILLQLGLAPAIALYGCSPDFLLVPVVLIALRSGYAPGCVAGFLLGLLGDLAGSGAIGCAAFAYCIVALATGLVGALLQAGGLVSSLLIAVVMPFVNEFVFGLVSVLVGSPASGSLGVVMSHALPCAAYTLPFALIALVTIGLVMGQPQPAAGAQGSYMPVKYK